MEHPPKTASSQPRTSQRVWIKDLGLSLKEKYFIKKDQWVTSESMCAVAIIAKEQFPSVAGLQDTGYVPHFIETDNKWIYALPMVKQCTRNSVQIHHNGKNHWVVSVKIGENIYVVDSMMNPNVPLSASLQIQIAQLYSDGGNEIEVLLPNTNQQTNGSDCGVFAIGNLTYLCRCIQENVIPLFDKQFDETQIRNHLMRCFESREISKFPTTKCDQLVKFVKTKIPTECSSCHKPNLYEDMIECSNCSMWIHYSCNLTPIVRPTPDTWWCSAC